MLIGFIAYNINYVLTIYSLLIQCLEFCVYGCVLRVINRMYTHVVEYECWSGVKCRS